MLRVLPVRRIETALLIGVGGFVGANLRYVAELTVSSHFAATLLVNVIGSFLLGILLYEAMYGGMLSERMSVFFGTGFLSSFTTYSAFAMDVFTADPVTALGYVLASYALGFTAIFAGQYVAIRLEAI